MRIELTKKQYVECYDCVFTKIHSDGFKAAEMKDLINDENYSFLELPKEGWRKALTLKLKEMGFDYT